LAQELIRHEYKYYLNGMDAKLLERRLSSLMNPDPNAGEDGAYLIRSLYFDDYADTALADNLAGVDNRAKYRLRTYGLDRHDVKLEKKVKLDGLTGKRTAHVTRQQATSITAGDVDWLRESGEPLFLDFYLAHRMKILSPKVIVEYVRTAFMADAGKTRITIDRSIKASVASLDIFNEELALAPILEVGVCVLEVKYDAFLPGHIAQAIQISPRMRQSASKFAIGRMYGSYANN
jgi:hypothetical protein